MEEEASMILVMGVTGAGKSYFVNKLVEKYVLESEDLASETQSCKVVQTTVCGTAIGLVDTPGFDDTRRTDGEILEEITRFLVTQYECGIPLKGLVFLHKITDNRMTGTSQRYLEVVRRMCGQNALRNVFLVTTHWSELSDQALGRKRERSLREEYWREMLQNKSCMFRFDGSGEDAEAIMMRMLTKQDLVLDIQQQLIVQNMAFEDTDAGRLIVPAINTEMKEQNKRIAELNAHIRREGSSTTLLDQKKTVEEKQRILVRVRESCRKNRLVKHVRELIAENGGASKTALQVFSSVLGIVLGIAQCV